MTRAIWSGTVSFGLVSIPVKLVPAVRTNELRFHFLHDHDKSPVSYRRVCEKCGEEVAWDHVVRGFEVSKGRYVVLKDEDFKRVDVEATQSVEIAEFVALAEIDPMLFDRPYYLEPEKKGRHPYALLRDVLEKTGKVGIARVVIREREHLAAVRPRADALVLELMRFADEIVDASEYDFPGVAARAHGPRAGAAEGARVERASPAEMKAAAMLVEAMTAKFDPAAFKDRYREELLALIAARAHGQRGLPKRRGAAGVAAKRASNVIDLKEVLARSLRETRKHRGQPAGKRGRVA